MSRNLKLLIALIIFGTIAAYVLLVTIPTEMARRSYEGAKTLVAAFDRVSSVELDIILAQVALLESIDAANPRGSESSGRRERTGTPARAKSRRERRRGREGSG